MLYRTGLANKVAILLKFLHDRPPFGTILLYLIKWYLYLLEGVDSVQGHVDRSVFPFLFSEPRLSRAPAVSSNLLVAVMPGGGQLI